MFLRTLLTPIFDQPMEDAMVSEVVLFGVFKVNHQLHDLLGALRLAGTDLFPREAESGKGSLPIFSSTKFTRRNLKRERKEHIQWGEKMGVDWTAALGRAGANT